MHSLSIFVPEEQQRRTQRISQGRKEWKNKMRKWGEKQRKRLAKGPRVNGEGSTEAAPEDAETEAATALKSPEGASPEEQEIPCDHEQEEEEEGGEEEAECPSTTVPASKPEIPAISAGTRRHQRVSLSRIKRRAQGPLADGPTTLQALRSMCRRMMDVLEPCHPRSKYWDARLWDDSVSGIEIVAWLVSDGHNDAGSAEDAYWIGQALVNHGLLRRSVNVGSSSSAVSVETLRACRRFEPASEARYRFDRLSLCPLRLRVDLHAARNLQNLHLLKRAGSPYVRCVVGGAVFFESRVVEGDLSPVWNETYEVGCKPGERVELQVLDRDAGLIKSQNLGDLDLGSVDDMMAKSTTQGSINGEDESDALVQRRRRQNEALDTVYACQGQRGLLRKAHFIADDKKMASGNDAQHLPRYLPLMSASGGHGSDSAVIAVRARVFQANSAGDDDQPYVNFSSEGAEPAKRPPVKDDGVREWVVRCRALKARNVAYDLAETWGLQFCMRTRIVVGDREACNAMADKDVASGSCEWEDDEPLGLEASLNRACETATLVVCERARSDLIERRVAFATIPISSLPVVTRTRHHAQPTTSVPTPPSEQRALDATFFSNNSNSNDTSMAEELAFAPPRWIDLERSAGGTRASPLRSCNGQILASLWIERIVDDDDDVEAYEDDEENTSSNRRLQKGSGSFFFQKDGLLPSINLRDLALVVFLVMFALFVVFGRGVLPWMFVACRGSLFATLRLGWLALRLPLAILGSLAIAAPLLGFAPDVLGTIFSYVITRFVIARGSWTIQVPEVFAKSIAITCWLETQPPNFESKAGLPLKGGRQSSLAQGGASVKVSRNSSSCALMLRVVVRGFRFGNPPGYERDHLLSVDHFAFDAAISMTTLFALPGIVYDVVAKGELWRPTPSANEARRQANRRKGVSDAARRNAVPAIRFERIEFEGVDLNFEMHHGELNINAITRLIAEAEAFALADKRFAEQAVKKREEKLTGSDSSTKSDAKQEPGSARNDHDNHHNDDDHEHRRVPRPNQLVVRILGARGLFVDAPFAPTEDGAADAATVAAAPESLLPVEDSTATGPSADHVRLYSGLGFVEVRTRSERVATKAAPCTNGEGAWNETLRLQVTDPSSVIQIVARSENAPVGFALNWVMTAKWLVSQPTYCDHVPGRLDRLEDGRNGVKGWIKLRDSLKLIRPTNAPELLVEIEWVHVPGYYDASKHKGLAKTALEQLTQNTEESILRIVGMKICREMLADFPLKVDVWRVSVRDMQLHIKDLFMGKRGQSEVGDGVRNAICLPSTEIGDSSLRREADRALSSARTFARGVDISDFLERFFIRGVTPALLRQNAFNAALQQTASAFAKQIWLGEMLNFTAVGTGSSSGSSSSSALSNSTPGALSRLGRPPSSFDVNSVGESGYSSAAVWNNTAALLQEGRESTIQQWEGVRLAAKGLLARGMVGSSTANVPIAEQTPAKRSPPSPTIRKQPAVLPSVDPNSSTARLLGPRRRRGPSDAGEKEKSNDEVASLEPKEPEEEDGEESSSSRGRVETDAVDSKLSSQPSQFATRLSQESVERNGVISNDEDFPSQTPVATEEPTMSSPKITTTTPETAPAAATGEDSNVRISTRSQQDSSFGTESQ